MPTSAPTPLPYVVTGAISFSGVSLEEARAERRVFLRTLAILLGVDESWVRVAIRRARRSRRRLNSPNYVPSTAPTCVEIKILRRVRPPRHRRDACSMAWRCRFLAARRNQRGHAIAEI